MVLPVLPKGDLYFPPLETALVEPNGLLAMGGDLSPDRLEAAYQHGCFPWFNAGQPILWWSPDPRMVLLPESLHISRSMKKFLKSNNYQVTFDQDFPSVIKACSEPRVYSEGTWITEAMQAAYITLHNKGLAHSVEVWQDDTLVGGLYGLAVGRLFFGESMFSRADNASKYGFIHLVNKLKKAGFVLIDCQMHTDHLQSLGAAAIPRKRFAEYLQQYINQPANIDWQSDDGIL